MIVNSSRRSSATPSTGRSALFIPALDAPSTKIALPSKNGVTKAVWKGLTQKLSRSFSAKSRENSSQRKPIDVHPAPSLLPKVNTATETNKRFSLTLKKSTHRLGNKLSVFTSLSSSENLTDGHLTSYRDNSDSASIHPQISNNKLTRMSVSDELSSLLKSIPADFPLIRYMAECLSLFMANANEEKLHIDVEHQLFFKCVKLKKWEISQTLAEKMQRQMARQVASKVICRNSKIPSQNDADTEVASIDNEHDDIILSFLNDCASLT